MGWQESPSISPGTAREAVGQQKDIPGAVPAGAVPEATEGVSGSTATRTLLSCAKGAGGAAAELGWGMVTVVQGKGTGAPGLGLGSGAEEVS